MAADRLDAPDGAGALDLERLGRGLAHAAGWNPILLAAAIGGLVALFLGRSGLPGRWCAVLVASLIAAPVVATLLAAIALPVHTGALVLCAPGIALAAGATAPVLAPVRGLVVTGLGLLLVASAVDDRGAAQRAGGRGLARSRDGREAGSRRPRDGRRGAGALARRVRVLRAVRPGDPLRPPRRCLGRRGGGHARRRDRLGAPVRAARRATRCCGSSATGRTCGCSTGCGRREARTTG